MINISLLLIYIRCSVQYNRFLDIFGVILFMQKIKISIIIFTVMIFAIGMARADDEALYCPEPNTLQKDSGWWKVDNIWKSDSESSGKKIKSFIGAQWIGVRIGKIICLYTEEQKYAFPVALATVKAVLVFAPTASIWIETKKGYKNCVSHNILDCPFVQQKVNEELDLYEQIKYKDKNTD